MGVFGIVSNESEVNIFFKCEINYGGPKIFKKISGSENGHMGNFWIASNEPKGESNMVDHSPKKKVSGIKNGRIGIFWIAGNKPEVNIKK